MFAQQILNIEPGTLDDVDMDIFIGSSYKEDQAMNELRQVAFQDHSKNLLSMGQLAKLYTVDSLIEMEHLLEKYGEMAEQKAIAGQKREQDFEVQLKQLEGQMHLIVEQEKSKYKATEIQIQQATLQLEKDKFMADNKVKEDKIRSDEVIAAAKLGIDEKVIEADIEGKNKEISSAEKLAQIEDEREKIKIQQEDKHHKEEQKTARMKPAPKNN
jgi:hypothetical protein